MTQDPFYKPPFGPINQTPEPPVEEPVAPSPAPVGEEPFTLEKGKERLAEAGDRVKQAGKEITTQPFLDALGSYFNRAVDALIGLADGASGKKKDQK